MEWAQQWQWKRVELASVAALGDPSPQDAGLGWL
jgi:hypothetical protein